MATTTNVRITYPLSLQDVEELQALEKNLRQKSADAEKANKVGLHRAYAELMKSTTRIVTRERNRMSREDVAELNRRQLQLRQQAKQGGGTAPTASTAGNVSA